MRRALIGAGLATLIAAASVVTAMGPAAAGTICQVIDPLSGACLVTVTDPGDPPAGDPGNGNADPVDTGSGSACFWDPSKSGFSAPPAGPVDCTLNGAYWSNAHQCYVRVEDPQPPAGDPTLEGHDVGDGAVYDCWQPQTDLEIYFWAADPPEPAAAGPSPRQVAQIAVDRMNLRALTIGIVPEPGKDSVGLVGMPVWMWAADPGPSSVGPVTATASAGGVTITATARLNKVTWDMGDGHTVVCRGAGTAYQPADGRTSSPDCGYRYTTSSAGKPGDVFTVTATSDWVVTWQGAGQNGVIRMDGLTRSVQIAVGEAQVLVTS